MKKICLLLTAILMATMTFAYDFTVVDNYGNTIYLQFSFSGEDCVEVTNNNGTYGAYSGTVEIPAEVLATKPGDTAPKMYPVATISLEAFRECHGLTKVILPTSIRTIEPFAFYKCDQMETITLPGGVNLIYGHALAECSQLKEIICLADAQPTLMDTTAFCTKIDTIPATSTDDEWYNCHEIASLKVPVKKLDEYKYSIWSECFTTVEGIDCGNSVVEELHATTADIKWRPEKKVVQYTIDIYKGGNPFAQYIFDGEGKEVSHQKFAPAIHKADTTQNTTSYFVVTLEGLSENTGYSYTVHGLNNQSEQIYQDNGAFKTKAKDEDGIEQITNDSLPMTSKFLRNGMLLIERNGRRYTAEGKELE